MLVSNCAGTYFGNEISLMTAKLLKIGNYHLIEDITANLAKYQTVIAFLSIKTSVINVCLNLIPRKIIQFTLTTARIRLCVYFWRFKCSTCSDVEWTKNTFRDNYAYRNSNAQNQISCCHRQHQQKRISGHKKNHNYWTFPFSRDVKQCTGSCCFIIHYGLSEKRLKNRKARADGFEWINRLGDNLWVQ